jgi:hypothetical protein
MGNSMRMTIKKGDRVKWKCTIERRGVVIGFKLRDPIFGKCVVVRCDHGSMLKIKGDDLIKIVDHQESNQIESIW